MPVTRTLGPLHLEDLEPHRFEDLIRQLLYDFRPWRDLEATGRTGSDEGFDARAWEIVGAAETPNPADSDEDDLEPQLNERQWLIQCKREKAIGPKKIEGYLDGLPGAADTGLYGIIFAAACDFSIETRDRFYARARELGFQEVKLWGKAEVEDQLYQPKNDHLLFAYFGVSLQVRRRSLKTEVRGRLAMKRKALRHLQPHSDVLVRDASDERYPYLDRDKTLPREIRGRWNCYKFSECGPFGVELLFKRHFAYVDDDGERWDMAERMNDARPHRDRWPNPASANLGVARSADMKVWDGFAEKNKGWYESTLVLPYERIIDIDADGDEFFQGPHIYVEAFLPTGMGPFADFYRQSLSTIGSFGQSCRPDPDKRIAIFPRKGEVIEVVEEEQADPDDWG